MDYLRSAASAVLSKSAGPLPGFTIGSPVASSSHSSPTIWTLHEGTKRDDGSACTIFIFESGSSGSSAHLTLARNALRKLRTLRHPDVLKLIDSNETQNGVYIAVEPVRRLVDVLRDWNGTEESKRESCVWGLSTVANALKFIHSSAASIHGNVRPESIYVSQGGQWKLGGFEVLTAKEDYQGVIWSLAGSLPDASLYASPDVKQNGWSILRDQDTHTLDSYSFALLACTAFNDYQPGATTQSPPQGSIPPPLFALLRRMLSPTPKTRMSVGQLFDAASVTGGVFKINKLAMVQEGCDGLMLASDAERASTIGLLQKSSSSLPPDFLTHVVLPCLVNALQLSCQAATQQAQQAQQAQQQLQSAPLSRSIHPNTLLPLVLQLGQPLSDAAWTQSILPCILDCFTSSDRSIRMTLLEHLSSYVTRIDSRKVSDSIWPRLITGFGDSSTAIREATLKSILDIAPKLTDRIKNNDLLRQLAKTQVDVEESIRTNTTILLGRLSPQLNASTRKNVLIPAFSRSLKDPFVHARVAGLMAFMATSEGEGSSYDTPDFARSILPVVTVLLVDGEKVVRDQALQAVELFLSKVKEGVKDWPEGTGGEGSSSGGGLTAVGGGATASTAGGAASALAGWAVNGAMSYLNRDAQTAASTSAPPPAPAPTPGAMDNKRPTLLTGASSSGASTPAIETPPRLSAPRAAPTDLIDIEDDTADWSSFESAPARKPIQSKRTTARGISSTGMSRLAASASGDDSAWGAADSAGGSGTSTPSTTATAAVVTEAFKAPVPSWDQGEWGAEETTKPATDAAPAQPVSKEDKRAAMDRQREERRERMRKLKESKGKKLGDALV